MLHKQLISITTSIGRTLFALSAIGIITVWNTVIRARETPIETAVSEGSPSVIEHERSWAQYIRGYDIHHGSGTQKTGGSFWRGLLRWSEGGFLRGYTIGDDVYLCPNTPRIVRVHQAGHAPRFAEAFEPLTETTRENGGLPDEPLYTFDIMLPGGFPHTFLRLTDRRGLSGAYRLCLANGLIRRNKQ